MSEALDKIINSLKAESDTQKQDAELQALGQSVQKSVDEFLTSQDLGTSQSGSMAPNDAVTLEGIQGEVENQTSLAELVDQAQIPENLKDQAIEQVSLLLYKHFNPTTGKNGNSMFSAHMAPSQEGQSNRELSTLFSNEMADQLVSTQEGFGANVNVTTPDLRMAITVALMRFHMGLMPRVLPTKVIDSATAVYTVPRVSVFDLSKQEPEYTQMLDLFSNPQMVSNELPQIEPLKDNDTDDVLVADNLIKFNKQANILTLSIDSDKTGYGKINHTDHVADGPRLDSIRIGLANSSLDAGATHYFNLVIPADKNRLTRLADSPDSADRALNLHHEFFLGHNTEDETGSASVLFQNADVDPGSGAMLEGVKVTVQASVQINLKNGKVTGLGTIQVEPHQVNGENLSADFAADLGVDAGDLSNTLGDADDNITTVEANSYTLDAKFSEENLRKTSIAVRQDQRSFAYDIPIGRHYVYDSALTQEVPESIPGNLSRVVQLGEDHIALTLMKDTLSSVYDRLMEEAQGLSNMDVGRNYVAGSMVKPTVIQGSIDISDLNSIRDSDRSGDIKQRIESFLVALTTRLQSNSYIQEQMASGTQVTYRCATTIKILGCVLGLDHVHQHLSTGQAGKDSSGVEYRMVLSNGVVIEVVTTNFDSMEDQMILVPHLEDNPESVLNFGTVWDMGTLVGQLDYASSDGTHKRMYANARQLMIPTNPVGAIVDITGAYDVNETDMST